MEPPWTHILKRWVPLGTIGLALGLVWYFQLYQYLSFHYLASKHHQLQQWTEAYYLLMVLGYMIIYAASVAVSVPGAALLTILGGYLFGLILGPIYVIVSATLGASAIFALVRLSLGDMFTQYLHTWGHRLQRGLRQNAFYYLLSLRLIPIVPFWVLNIVPALLNVRFRTFFFATLLGIAPGSIVYASLGNGLGTLFEKGEPPDLGIILEPHLLLPLIGLAVLALLPVVTRHSQAK